MVRQKIRQRMKELAFIGNKAKEEGKQNIMLDAMIRRNELELLLKELKK